MLKNHDLYHCPWSASPSSNIWPKPCVESAVLFTFIATFSRSPRAEHVVQNLIAITLIAAAGVLWWLSLSGGVLWGSNYLPKPLSLVCVVIAIAARMNIKGENVSFGANPHTIGKNQEE